jgi:hypothetical protein
MNPDVIGYDPSLLEEYLSKSLHGDWREKVSL